MTVFYYSIYEIKRDDRFVQVVVTLHQKKKIYRNKSDIVAKAFYAA